MYIYIYLNVNFVQNMREKKQIYVLGLGRPIIKNPILLPALFIFPFFYQFGWSYLKIDYVDKPTKEVSNGVTRTGFLTSFPPTNAAYSV